jgi:rRNA-processing protein FCF1
MQQPALVLLDANFVLVPLQLGLDIYDLLPGVVEGPFSVGILEPILGEVEQIAAGTGGETAHRQAEAGLEILRGNRVEVLPATPGTNELNDDLLLRYAQEKIAEGKLVLVATNDGALRQRLRAGRVPVIYVRKKAVLGRE